MKIIFKITTLTIIVIMMVNSIMFIDNLVGYAKGTRNIDKYNKCFNMYMARQDIQDHYCINFFNK